MQAQPVVCWQDLYTSEIRGKRSTQKACMPVVCLPVLCCAVVCWCHLRVIVIHIIHQGGWLLQVISSQLKGGRQQQRRRGLTGTDNAAAGGRGGEQGKVCKGWVSVVRVVGSMIEEMPACCLRLRGRHWPKAECCHHADLVRFQGLELTQIMLQRA